MSDLTPEQNQAITNAAGITWEDIVEMYKKLTSRPGPLELPAMYGFKVVKIDNFEQFHRDVTLVTVEIPNEVFERLPWNR